MGDSARTNIRPAGSSLLFFCIKPELNHRHTREYTPKCTPKYTPKHTPKHTLKFDGMLDRHHV